MGCSLILAGNAALANPQVWVLFVIAVIWGVLDAVQRPSLDAMLPRLVDRDELPAAAALNSLRSTLGQILGPAIGGVLLAAIGLPLTYMVDVTTFVVGLACLWLMRAVPPPVDAERQRDLLSVYAQEIEGRDGEGCLRAARRPTRCLRVRYAAADSDELAKDW